MTNGLGKDRIAELERRALNVRRSIIRMIATAGSGHPAGALGLVEIMIALYFEIMQYNQNDPNDPDRDLLVLSNGHVCPVLYATMAEVGLIPMTELASLRRFGSRLQGHPERASLPWLETTSGPLGEGISQAAGMAYDLKYLEPANNRQVYCIVGDGELDEGQNWEAVMVAGKYHLDNLTVIVDSNDIQLSGKIEDILPLGHQTAKWRSSGWNVLRLRHGDANRIEPIVQTLRHAHDAEWLNVAKDKPTVILAETIPGKGVSFMENDYRWHGKAPSQAEAEAALAELDKAEQELANATA